MEALAEKLSAVAAALTGAAGALRMAGADPGAFGVDHDGVPGLLGGALHQRWTAALHARSDEIDAAAARVAETAEAVRTVRREYADTDDLARRRLQRRS